MKRYGLLTLLIISCLVALGRQVEYGKMSGFVRQIVLEQAAQSNEATRLAIPSDMRLCAFVQTDGLHEDVLRRYHCRLLASFGHIHIVDIPLESLPALSCEQSILRIESGSGNNALMDITPQYINALPVYAGKSLPQAYTGKGVVVGVEDIGFDLTHPNFCDSTGTTLRIKAFWDQLSTDTIGSTLYVGADYTTEEKLFKLAHSRDGKDQTHGTHTLGIAAGSGFSSPYRGVAFESDLCLVANLTGENVHLIPKKDRYKYTYATDALGFKYIMDYAQREGKPCVVSFSEGGLQDFHGDDRLYYAILDSLSGPGRIIVASAGNNGAQKSYLHKDKGRKRAGTFVKLRNGTAYCTLKSDADFRLQLVFYRSRKDTTVVDTKHVLQCTDSLLKDTIRLGAWSYELLVQAYPSAYDKREMAYDVMLKQLRAGRYELPMSIELLGENADVEMFRGIGQWYANTKNMALRDGDYTHSILSPGSAPSVICVGATSYRTHLINYRGVKKVSMNGSNGERAPYSSVGPTFDGRTKPDVMAPGSNIISSYNSFYLENHPAAGDVDWDVKRFQHKGRTYSWTSNTGTSMSAPAVAGAIALWLQAKPSLTANEIRGVFSRTCTHYDSSLSYPNNEYGHGQIDVYQGLLDILGLTHVPELSREQPVGVQFQPLPNQKVAITFADTQSHTFRLRVYSVSGSLLLSMPHIVSASNYEVDLSRFQSGVYVIQIDGDSASCTGSTLLRL